MKSTSAAAAFALLFLFKGPWIAAAQESEEWTIYEDPRLRVEHPKDWKASFDESPPAHAYRIWFIKPPDFNLLGVGTILIREYRDGKEKRPLEKIFSPKDWRRMKVIREPQRFQVRGGECLSFMLEGRVGFFFPHADPIETRTVVYCYDKKKQFHEIESTHSQHATGERDGRFQKNLKIFERILKSIEFK
jgi:hypothetical protein